MFEKEPLVLTFDPQTVDHLGAKMYSQLPNAVAELVANAYDADATSVRIFLRVDGSIAIEDDGHGMSREDVSDKYLHIGRNRRVATDTERTESGRRLVSGKKGLGKLALFGIGRLVKLATTRKGSSTRTVVTLSYDDMMSSEGAYQPSESTETVEADAHGTMVELSVLKRATAVVPIDLATSLSRLFNYFGADFSVTVVGPDGAEFEVTPALRLTSVDVEFEWRFPEAWVADDSYAIEKSIVGVIVASKSPLRQGMRGITLYVNGWLANEPEFFGSSESSFAFSYLTGYLEVDFLDTIEPDVIATDRRGIDWDTEETLLLRGQLQKLMVRIGQEWRLKRAEARRRLVEDDIGGPTETWVESIQSEEQDTVRDLVSAISSDDIDMTADQQSQLIGLVREVAPPHAEYVWRHLHPEIKAATRAYYETRDYYTAIQEALKRYVNATKKASQLDIPSAAGLVAKAFGTNGTLRVFAKYMADGGFDPQTEQNVEEGQKHVSMGVVGGFRNPLAHEEIKLLQESGAFTNDDCLDALSIVSHLMRRLDDAVEFHGS